MKKERIILAGDVGATKTLLGLFHQNHEGLVLWKEARFPTQSCRQFEKLVKNFLSDFENPDVVCMGIAGPVLNGKVSITNISLTLESEKLSAALDGTPVYFINDLEATAHGLPQLKKEEFHTVLKGKNHPGNLAVIAPGTGLGEAAAWWDGSQYHPFATEGGHCDFAPRTEMDFALLQYLTNKLGGHVSWERLISGPGIINIFEFLDKKDPKPLPEWLKEKLMYENPAAVISANASTIKICYDTMELFFRYLATECANLALKTKATGGLYIGGGFIPEVLSLLDMDTFEKHFTDFGRLKFLLQQIPVKVILNTSAALLGAASYGATLVRNRHVSLEI